MAVETLVQTEISQQLLDGFCTDMHGGQRIKPTDFNDPLTFPIVPPLGQSFYLFCEIYQLQLDGLAQDVVYRCRYNTDAAF